MRHENAIHHPGEALAAAWASLEQRPTLPGLGHGWMRVQSMGRDALGFVGHGTIILAAMGLVRKMRITGRA